VRDELKFGQDKVYHTARTKQATIGIGSIAAEETILVSRFAKRGRRLDPGDARESALQVEVENGIYDLATPFFATEYTMEHLALPEKLQKNIHLQYYDAGHMMYLRDEDLAKLKANIASFIDGASKQ